MKLEANELRSSVDAAHHLHSSLREKIVEHVFVGEALRALWRRGVFDVEVLRTEFDAHGYDLVMGRGKVVRHIQFKTGVRDRPRRISIASALDMRCFYWLGAGPEEPLPALGDRPPKRIGRTVEGIRPLREKHRMINGSAFRKIDTMGGILETLFGPLPTGKPPVLTDEDEQE